MCIGKGLNRPIMTYAARMLTWILHKKKICFQMAVSFLLGLYLLWTHRVLLVISWFLKFIYLYLGALHFGSSHVFRKQFVLDTTVPRSTLTHWKQLLKESRFPCFVFYSWRGFFNVIAVFYWKGILIINFLKINKHFAWN